MGQDFLSTAHCGSNGDLVLTLDVRRIRDRFSVRRPARMVLVGIAGIGEISGRAVLSRNGDNVTPRREHGTLAVRGQCVIGILRGIDVTNRFARVRIARAGARCIIRNADVQAMEFFRWQIDHP